jgi:hypothetical protein
LAKDANVEACKGQGDDDGSERRVAGVRVYGFRVLDVVRGFVVTVMGVGPVRTVRVFADFVFWEVNFSGAGGVGLTGGKADQESD